MTFRYYPSEEIINEAKKNDEPLMIVISFDGQNVIAAPMDEVVEHHILLEKCGIHYKEIDKHFRVIVDKQGADWTFICPPDYKNIFDKRRRIGKFYNDGCNYISKMLNELGYIISINIPIRYRRHLNELHNGN